MEEHCFNRNIIELNAPSTEYSFVTVLEVGAPNCWTIRIDASSKLAVSWLQALLVRLNAFEMSFVPSFRIPRALGIEP